MDAELCDQLSNYVEILTTSGKKELDKNTLKKTTQICKKSDRYVEHIYHLLMHQLERDHAEIRYSALQMCDELFKRSHQFRELLVSDFQTFLELTVEIDPEQLLPPPLPVAKSLKRKAYEFILEWHEKYGEGYKKLKLGYNFLKECKKIDFSDIHARGVAERQRESEREKHQENVNVEKRQRYQREIDECLPEIESCVRQIKECFRILMPETIQMFSDINFDDPQPGCSKGLPEMDVDSDEWMRDHGIASRNYSLTVEVKQDKWKLKVTENNRPIFETLKELHQTLSSKYMPLISKWIQAIIKTSSNNDHLKKAIDLKNNVEEMLKSCRESGIESLDINQDNSDDSDLEEVETKEGYEPVIPQHRRAEYGLLPLTKNDSTTSVKPATASTRWQPFDTGSNADETHDPTSIMSNLPRLENLAKELSAHIADSRKRAELDDQKAKLISLAPKLRYDTDLMNWGEEKPEVPSVVKLDSLHRFWTPINNETSETAAKPDDIAMLRTRVMEFSGKFEPVKWECRAPMPSGRLCPRQDRYKCPLHGRIIPRDNMGNPTDAKDRERLETEKLQEQIENPEWQDPALLRDIKEATGIDLTMPKKRTNNGSGEKPKKKKQKFPGLTDLNAKQSTTRKRLEKKVLNKSALAKVAQTLDSLDYRKHKDKFGDQFNYSCQT